MTTKNGPKPRLAAGHMKGLAMSDLKDKETKERTKERREKEKQPQQQRSKDSIVGGPHGEWKMSVVYEAAYKMDIDPIVANKWVDYMDEVGWTQTDDVPITEKHFRRSLRMFGRMERKIAAREARRRANREAHWRGNAPDYEALEAKKRAIEAKRREEASKADGAWATSSSKRSPSGLSSASSMPIKSRNLL